MHRDAALSRFDASKGKLAGLQRFLERDVRFAIFAYAIDEMTSFSNIRVVARVRLWKEMRELGPASGSAVEVT
jgi:hypothetical protein